MFISLSGYPHIHPSSADTAPPPGRFSLGRVAATPGALAAIPSAELQSGLCRHHHGDWGDLCDDDRGENERSLRDGCRLMSVYHTKAGVKFYIITEADRSVTTCLLPGEY